MRAHVTAIRAALTTASVTNYFIDVPAAPTFPYVLLWTSAGRMVSLDLCGIRSALDDTLGVTAVGKTAESALAVQAKARAVLDGHAFVVPSRRMDDLRLYDAQPVQVDRDAPLPGTGYAKYCVDLYRISSTPA